MKNNKKPVTFTRPNLGGFWVAFTLKWMCVISFTVFSVVERLLPDLCFIRWCQTFKFEMQVYKLFIRLAFWGKPFE